MRRWFWPWRHSPGLEEMNLRRGKWHREMVLGMARGFWGQEGGPGHEGGGPGLRKGVLSVRRCYWAQMLRTGEFPGPGDVWRAGTHPTAGQTSVGWSIAWMQTNCV